MVKISEKLRIVVKEIPFYAIKHDHQACKNITELNIIYLMKWKHKAQVNL